MQAQAMVQVRTNQTYGDVYAALALGGIARRPTWNPRAFYKLEEGTGLVLVAGDGGQPTLIGEPTLEETLAIDWLTLTPMTMESLGEVNAATPGAQIRGIAFVEAEDSIRHQQANDAQQIDDHLEEGPAFYYCDFSDAMGAILDGLAARRPGRELVFLMRAMGECRIATFASDQSIIPFEPDQDDMVADDWVVVSA